MTDTLTTEQIIALAKQHVVGNYTRYPVCLVRGDGSWVWDAEGNRYLDFFPGWGCGILGHCPPRVVQAVQEQVATLIHVPNTWYTEPQVLLAQALGERSGFDGQSFFCNSGTEAVEAAIKLARLNGKPKGRYKIVTMTNSFHGRTMGALTATAQPKYHFGVEPLLPGFNYAPFGDLDAVSKTIDGETAAILLEPIQGEGGINLPPNGFLEGLRDLCDRHGLLLIFDEVQSGMGRTGRMWASDHFDLVPDILTVAKGIASGMPLSATIAKVDLMQWKPGAHASTFGGNPVAVASALATVELLEQELIENAARVGEHMMNRLSDWPKRFPNVGDVRGRGLMIGIELVHDQQTRERFPELRNRMETLAFERGLLILGAGPNSIRLCPPLTLTRDQADFAIDTLEDCLKTLTMEA